MAMGSIRLSKKSVDLLAQLTRHTGIAHRNVLCRWAFAVSLQKGPAAPLKGEVFDVAIDWMTFAGLHSVALEAILQLEARSLSTESHSAIVEAHIGRGLIELATAIKSSGKTVKVPKIGAPEKEDELRICDELAWLIPRALQPESL